MRNGSDDDHVRWRRRGSFALAAALTTALLLIGLSDGYAAMTGAAWQEPPPTTAPAQPTGDDQEEAKAAIRRLIEEKLKEKAQAQPATQPRKPVIARPPGATSTQPAAATTLAPMPVAVTTDQPPTTQPTSQPGGGCGGTQGQVDLTPPAPDQPQPKWACDQAVSEAPPVWRGKWSDFVFKVRNDGEGVLNILLTGG